MIREQLNVLTPAAEKTNSTLKQSESGSSVTHLGTVQVLMFLQQLVRLLDRHLIVAIIKIICRNTRQNITLIWVCFLSLQSAVYRQQHINWIILLLLLLPRQISSDSCLIGSCPEDQYIRCLVLETSALQ